MASPQTVLSTLRQTLTAPAAAEPLSARLLGAESPSAALAQAEPQAGLHAAIVAALAADEPATLEALLDAAADTVSPLKTWREVVDVDFAVMWARHVQPTGRFVAAFAQCSMGARWIGRLVEVACAEGALPRAVALVEHLIDYHKAERLLAWARIGCAWAERGEAKASAAAFKAARQALSKGRMLASGGEECEAAAELLAFFATQASPPLAEIAWAVQYLTRKAKTYHKHRTYGLTQGAYWLAVLASRAGAGRASLLDLLRGYRRTLISDEAAVALAGCLAEGPESVEAWLSEGLAKPRARFADLIHLSFGADQTTALAAFTARWCALTELGDSWGDLASLARAWGAPNQELEDALAEAPVTEWRASRPLLLAVRGDVGDLKMALDNSGLPSVNAASALRPWLAISAAPAGAVRKALAQGWDTTAVQLRAAAVTDQAQLDTLVRQVKKAQPDYLWGLYGGLLVAGVPSEAPFDWAALVELALLIPPDRGRYQLVSCIAARVWRTQGLPAALGVLRAGEQAPRRAALPMSDQFAGRRALAQALGGARAEAQASVSRLKMRASLEGALAMEVVLAAPESTVDEARAWLQATHKEPQAYAGLWRERSKAVAAAAALLRLVDEADFERQLHQLLLLKLDGHDRAPSVQQWLAAFWAQLPADKHAQVGAVFERALADDRFPRQALIAGSYAWWARAASGPRLAEYFAQAVEAGTYVRQAIKAALDAGRVEALLDAWEAQGTPGRSAGYLAEVCGERPDDAAFRAQLLQRVLGPKHHENVRARGMIGWLRGISKKPVRVAVWRAVRDVLVFDGRLDDAMHIDSLIPSAQRGVSLDGPAGAVALIANNGPVPAFMMAGWVEHLVAQHGQWAARAGVVLAWFGARYAASDELAEVRASIDTIQRHVSRCQSAATLDVAWGMGLIGRGETAEGRSWIERGQAAAEGKRNIWVRPAELLRQFIRAGLEVSEPVFAWILELMSFENATLVQRAVKVAITEGRPDLLAPVALGLGCTPATVRQGVLNAVALHWQAPQLKAAHLAPIVELVVGDVKATARLLEFVELLLWRDGHVEAAREVASLRG